MNRADREGLYVLLVGGAALGAQALAGVVIARVLGASPWTGVAAAMVAGLWAADIQANASTAAPWDVPPGPARVLMAPAMVGEWAADTLVRPWLLPAGSAPAGSAPAGGVAPLS